VLCTPDGLTWPAWRWPRHAPGGPSEEADVAGGSRFLAFRLGPWMDRAACRGMVTSADEEIFFAPELDELGGNRGAARRLGTTRERQALAVCDRCPVQVECLAYAVATRQQHGVWGGKTQQELRRLVANTDRAKRRAPVDVGGLSCTNDTAGAQRGLSDRRIGGCDVGRSAARFVEAEDQFWVTRTPGALEL
jgi:WhiB family redox-sensing transcriptional regulator